MEGIFIYYATDIIVVTVAALAPIATIAAVAAVAAVEYLSTSEAIVTVVSIAYF